VGELWWIWLTENSTFDLGWDVEIYDPVRHHEGQLSLAYEKIPLQPSRHSLVAVSGAPLFDDDSPVAVSGGLLVDDNSLEPVPGASLLADNFPRALSGALPVDNEPSKWLIWHIYYSLCLYEAFATSLGHSLLGALLPTMKSALERLCDN